MSDLPQDPSLRTRGRERNRPRCPDDAFVDFASGDDIAVGDRATTDSPMFYWHPDPPPP
ncbi:MAG TPA: hypothetical protein VH044_15715 [Polyangiaceae bacterium]|nr:hypothetical protein [Polyangiaceae bacterium]